MPAKKIGIPISRSKTQHYINQAYVDFVIGAGYTPDLIVQSDIPEKDMAQYYKDKVKECHGLLLCGGVDIDPIFYGEDNITSSKTEPDKDNFERSLLYAFTENNKPVFGICRGFQLLVREYLRTNGRGGATTKNNVELSFYQNITDHNDIARLDVPRDQPTSFVSADTASLYLKNKGDTIAINSIHHQGAVLSGQGIKGPIPVKSLKIIAWKQHQGLKPSGIVIEAIDFGSFFNKTKVVGVQWHPEELKDYELLHKVFGINIGVVEPENVELPQQLTISV